MVRSIKIYDTVVKNSRRRESPSRELHETGSPNSGIPFFDLTVTVDF